MQPDGIHFANESRAHVLLTSTLFWDFEVVEAPWIIYREPFYYLLFSSNTYKSPHYHVGVARSLSPTGPYTRNHEQNVIGVDMERYIHKNVTFVSPGEHRKPHFANDRIVGFIFEHLARTQHSVNFMRRLRSIVLYSTVTLGPRYSPGPSDLCSK